MKKKDQKPIAYYYGLATNAGGVIEVLDIEYGCNDIVKWRYNGGKVNRSMIRTGVEGSSYFIAYGYNVPLDDCIRADL